MKQRSAQRRRRALAAAALLALAAVGCGGARPDGPPVPDYPGHLAYVGADAEVVLTVNNLAERGRAVIQSKAYARFQDFANRVLGEDEARLQELAANPSDALDEFEELFAGRLTFVSYPAPEGGDPNGDDLFVVLTDGDPKVLVEALESDEEGQEAGTFEEVGGGVLRYAFADDEEPVFTLQHGGVGLVGSNPELLKRVAQVAQGLGGTTRLADQAPFKALRGELRQDADVFFWVRDWTSEQDDWDALLAGAPPSGRVEKAAAGTLMLDEGVDVEFLVEFGESDFEDPNTRAFFAAMRQTGQSSAIARMLPAGTVGYLGLNLNMVQMLDQLDLDTQGTPLQAELVRSLLKQVAASFSGEFGVAVTSLPQDQTPSPLLGYPVPGLVVIGKLADAGREEGVRRLLEAWLRSQSADAGGEFLGQRREETIAGEQAVLYATIDPTIDIGYVFHDGHLLLGTRQGLTDMLTASETGPAALELKSSAALITESLKTPSHYALYLDLASLYGFLRPPQGGASPFSAMLGPAGGPNGDPLGDLFQVFQHAGGNLSFTGERIYIRLYITATDLP